jgi:hypothetical protein
LSEITPEKPAAHVPADYYCTPVAEKDRMFPRWVPLGCGTASLIILIVLFAGGAFVNSGGGTRMFGWVFGRMQSELLAMCDKDVRPAQKTDFVAEMVTMEKRTEAGKVKSDDLLAVFRMIRDVAIDEHVTPAELDELTAKLRGINSAR